MQHKTEYEMLWPLAYSGLIQTNTRLCNQREYGISNYVIKWMKDNNKRKNMTGLILNPDL